MEKSTKKQIFSTVTSVAIWALMFLPFWIPDSCTGYVKSPKGTGEFTVKVWSVWVWITVLSIIMLAFAGLDRLMTRIADWLID